MSESRADLETVAKDLGETIRLVKSDLAASATERQTIRVELAEIKGLLLTATPKSRPLVTRVEDLERGAEGMERRLGKIEERDNVSYSGTMRTGTAIAITAAVTAIVTVIIAFVLAKLGVVG